MRIKRVHLSWFRGAAERATLEADGKSVVIYGPNGSGKSSFVDAVEYILENGKIGHLSHEYSGRKQEKGTRNTHAPTGVDATITIHFANDSEFKARIKPDGTTIFTKDDHVDIQEWEYKRTILRQDEVATFINARKGDKYSALLPLLDLGRLELAAENLRQLARTMQHRPDYRKKKEDIVRIQSDLVIHFGNQPESQIWNLIGGIYKKHLYTEPEGAVTDSHCGVIRRTLAERIANLSADQQKQHLLLDLRKQAILQRIQGVREISFDFMSEAEPFIEERLEILEVAARLADKVEGPADVTCPACGQSVSIPTFQEHVLSEQARLKSIIERFNIKRLALSRLLAAIKFTKETLAREELVSWLDNNSQAEVRTALRRLADLNIDELRTMCSERELREIEESMAPIVRTVEAATSEVPPDVQTLSADQQKVSAAEALATSRTAMAEVAAIEKLLRFVSELEKEVRCAIRSRSRAVIRDITADIEAMWSLLHPGERIEAVRLYVPEGSDKAIDIALQFYGIDQDSSRLTLSEGHRNSLGLCIFLAMAKKGNSGGRPLFLDDVVVSLDRNHRGMVAGLLQQHFDGRQVLILTHDREWYTELRQQLPQSDWKYSVLMPWHEPSVGIRWSSKGTSFDEARANLEGRPDAAANDARKIMDFELAFVAEKLRLRLPYLRGERNDFRTANDYIARLMGDAPKCLEKRTHDTYATCDEPVAVWRQAQRLLISWGNRGSHSFDLARGEVDKLIEACEKSLECFTCKTCNTWIWRADDAAGESVQCRCGQIRWRYGKG